MQRSLLPILLTVLQAAGCAAELATPEDDVHMDGRDEVDLGRSSADLSLSALSGGCTTAGVQGLAAQLIDETLCLADGALVRVEHPNIVLTSSRVHPYLSPRGREQLLQAAEGGTIQINSAFRSLAEQYVLGRGCSVAAAPGRSSHESGRAIDVGNADAAAGRLLRAGFRRPNPSGDPVHFEADGDDIRSLSVRAFQRLWNANHADDRIAEDGVAGPQTIARLGRSPADGFAVGRVCAAGAPTEPEPEEPGPTPPDPTTPPEPTSPVWRPAPGTSWQWQLTGTVDTSLDVEVYDIDLFDVPASVIDGLRSRGIKVICYFSAGSYEDWRPDARGFPAAALGDRMDGWDERWIDTRHAGVRDVMRARLDLAVTKRCDGVEPDNVDGYSNSTGFALTASTQVDYLRWLAAEAHARGLSVGLKNTGDLAPSVADVFDWALNEECLYFDDECAYLSLFVSAGKAAFHVEYDDVMSASAVCRGVAGRGYSTLLKHRSPVDEWRVSCD